MRRLRIGVIGLGMGRGHIRGYREHTAAEVSAIADPDSARLKKVGDETGIAARYPSGEAMLRAERLDVVSVATPNAFHAPLTIAALKAGCHVLCEKPMAMNAGEASRMLATARRAKRRIMINFSYRFTDAGRSLKAAADAGALGEVYFGRTAWHRSRGMPGFGGWFGRKALAGGGPLIDLGVHRLDLALWLMGHPRPAWVLAGAWDRIAKPLAHAQGKAFDVEDMAAGTIRFAGGSVLSLEASWAANLTDPELMETRLFGTKGGLVHRNRNGTYEFEGELYAGRGGRVERLPLPKVEPLKGGAMAHFVEAILSRRPHTATGEEGLAVMRILDAIYASARKGAPVRLGAARG